MKLRFKTDDRVILSDECNSSWTHQNKNKHGDIFGGTVLSTYPDKTMDGFHYRVKWDKGANSDICWYQDKDLAPEKIYENNKEATSLLSKEW
jgi:hypothetical protein